MTTTTLVFDPGNTTGWAQFENDVLVNWGQLDFDLPALWDLLCTRAPDVLVWESFNLHAHRRDSQIGSSFPAVQVIGVLRLYADQWGLDYTERTPQQVKQIWTDDKLRKFHFYQKGQPHANDAIRHGLTHLQIHKRNDRVRRDWLS